MQPDVSIIIVNYKTADLISECLLSIHGYTHSIFYEIIIVDNNSEPDYKEKIKISVDPNQQSLIQFIDLP